MSYSQKIEAPKNGWVRFIFFSEILLFILLLIPSMSWSVPANGGDVRRLYQTGLCTEVIASLQKWEGLNPLQLLYLGLCYLRLEDRKGAIDAWQNYLEVEKESDNGREISRYLTLLIQDEAKRNAKKQVTQEKGMTSKVDPKAIAVYPFQNLGLAENDYYAKGLAEFIITDLSQVKGLTVVERVEIQAVLDELTLSNTPLFDKESGPRVGKLVGAGKITTGSYLDLMQNKIRLNVSVIQTEEGRIITSPKASGPLNTFFQLEKEIVFKVLCGIGRCPESLDSTTRQAVEQIHTRNLKAFRLYSEGLDFFDRREYRRAGQNFFLALEEDPEFALARKGLLEMPIFPLDLEGIRAGAESLDPGEVRLPTWTVLKNHQQNNQMELIKNSIFQEPVCDQNCSAGFPATVPVDFLIHLPGNGK